MISKIIQKEKDRQVVRNFYLDEEDRIKHVEFKEFHKQSLINLKECLEKMYEQIEELTDWIDVCKSDSEKTGEGKCIIIQRGYESRDQLKEDIKALTEMIGRYG